MAIKDGNKSPHDMKIGANSKSFFAGVFLPGLALMLGLELSARRGCVWLSGCPFLDRCQVMQSYLVRALDRRLQVNWARDPREGPRVLMSLRVDFGPMG